jgi:hypothetical protein
MSTEAMGGCKCDRGGEEMDSWTGHHYGSQIVAVADKIEGVCIYSTNVRNGGGGQDFDRHYSTSTELAGYSLGPVKNNNGHGPQLPYITVCMRQLYL